MSLSDPRPVLVLGATGETGRRVVARLLAQGRSVRVLAREPTRARATLGPEVAVHEGDVRVPSSLQGMGRDVAGCISTIGTRTYFGANGGAAVDTEGTKHLVEALVTEGPSHLVMLSAFGLDRRSPFLSIFSAVLGDYFRHKAAAEAAVRTSELRWTLVRPVELRNRPPRGGPQLTQHAPLSLLRTVSRDRVAEVLVHCLGNPLAFERTFELCEGAAESIDAQLTALVGERDRRPPECTPLFG